MATDIQPGQTVRVTINKRITRAGAFKTLERLFAKDSVLMAPLEARAANFKAKPKRRGGRIWTKYPSKLHLELKPGTVGTVKATGQAIKDLQSVSSFVDIALA